jgi:gliding motility-associated-like protein
LKHTKRTNCLTNPTVNLKRIISVLSGLWLILSISLPQNVSVSGIANYYLEVTNVLVDRVRVNPGADLAWFHPGDKVLIIQMTGSTLYGSETYADFETHLIKSKRAWNSSGKFEILQVDEVITGANNYVVFTDNLSNSYNAGEKIQLVRFIEGETVTVSGALNAKKWDGNTGGIVALLGTDSVKLNANINVNYLGFRGGEVPAENYTAGCRADLSVTILDTLYFLPAELNRSGNKGEGIVTTVWPYTKGIAFALNGGGAGNGLYSGGGGGSNYNNGGDGGQQSSATCGLDVLTAAWGGYACKELYSLTNRQVILGGGGGSGVKSATKTASKGGDGGGLVFIITGTLVGNGRLISANGESAAAATGSGGGGGSGGTIMIDATNYITTFSTSIRGGNGGSTGSNCTGSGGGGSGGVLWHSGTSLAASLIDSTNGSPGAVSNPGCLAHIGNGGLTGVRLKNLLTPLTGFLFNSIRGVDTLCYGQTPNLLTGSQPKGGDGTYTWQWEQSIDQVVWIPAQGTATLRSIQPPALTQTTWYRRIVNSTSTITWEIIADTSRVLQVYVYPAITNNVIAGTDTICYNENGKPITGTLPGGGNSSYNYQWQHSANQTSWTNSIPVLIANNPLDPGVLTATRYFRRVVTSTAWCFDTSNSVTLTVLPLISNNMFTTPDTVICENQGPGLLNAIPATGGDGNYEYLWQGRSLSGSWTDISASNVLRYNPGSLTDSNLFRRIVFSGNDRACADTSGAKQIHVLPSIANNLLDSDADRYCAGEIPLQINGEQPLGGDSNYRYKWMINSGSSWQYIAGASAINYLPDEMVESDTRFKRVVNSGENDACFDTSADFSILVVPYIINILGVADQTICAYNTPAPLTVAPASAGLGGFTYQWIKQEEGETEWVNATGTSAQQSYSPGALTVSTLFARQAFSDICSAISDTVTITVYPDIAGNSILGDAVQYTCFNTPRELPGSPPVNGSGQYDYLWEESNDNLAWIPAGGTVNSGKDYGSDNLVTTKYFRRIVFSSPLLHECTDTSSAVQVRINPLPSGDVSSAVDTLCAGETLYVRFSVSGDNGPFDVTVRGLTDMVKNGIETGADSVAFTPSSTQQFVMAMVVDDSLCSADLSGNTGIAKAIVYEVPVANAGNDDEVCGNQYSLQAVKSISGSEGLWTAPGVIFDDSSSATGTVTADNFGGTEFTWTETNWHCTDTDETVITFYEQPLAPDAGSDQVLDFSFTTQLQALAPVVGSGKWTILSGTGEFNNDTLPEALVYELDVSNVFEWTVTNGNCPAVSDNVTITVAPLIIKKGFTPNGDNKNDFFDLGAVNAELIRIKIFNSAGMPVFESADYTNGTLWDGYNMNGVELPEGTYFYIIDMKIAGKAKEVQFRSFVEILR